MSEQRGAGPFQSTVCPNHTGRKLDYEACPICSAVPIHTKDSSAFMWNMITSIPKKRDALHKRICIVFIHFRNKEDFTKESRGQWIFEGVLGALAARIV